MSRGLKAFAAMFSVLVAVFLLVPASGQATMAYAQDSETEYYDAGNISEGNAHVQGKAGRTYFKVSAEVPEDGWYRLCYPDLKEKMPSGSNLDRINTFVPDGENIRLTGGNNSLYSGLPSFYNYNVSRSLPMYLTKGSHYFTNYIWAPSGTDNYGISFAISLQKLTEENIGIEKLAVHKNARNWYQKYVSGSLYMGDNLIYADEYGTGTVSPYGLIDPNGGKPLQLFYTVRMKEGDTEENEVIGYRDVNLSDMELIGKNVLRYQVMGTRYIDLEFTTSNDTPLDLNSKTALEAGKYSMTIKEHNGEDVVSQRSMTIQIAERKKSEVARIFLEEYQGDGTLVDNGNGSAVCTVTQWIKDFNPAAYLRFHSSIESSWMIASQDSPGEEPTLQEYRESGAYGETMYLSQLIGGTGDYYDAGTQRYYVTGDRSTSDFIEFHMVCEDTNKEWKLTALPDSLSGNWLLTAKSSVTGATQKLYIKVKGKTADSAGSSSKSSSSADSGSKSSSSASSGNASSASKSSTSANAGAGKNLRKVAVPTGKTLTYNGKSQTGVAAGSDYTISGNKAKKAGSYTATLTLKDAANCMWEDGTTASKQIGWKIDKARNSLKVKGKTATVKYSKLKKKARTLAVSKAIAMKDKGKGKLTFSKVSGSKKVVINKKSGKVTVKKGLKKGTYSIKVKVKAAGNANYRSAAKTVKFKVKVK